MTQKKKPSAEMNEGTFIYFFFFTELMFIDLIPDRLLKQIVEYHILVQFSNHIKIIWNYEFKTVAYYDIRKHVRQ